MLGQEPDPAGEAVDAAGVPHQRLSIAAARPDQLKPYPELTASPSMFLSTGTAM